MVAGEQPVELEGGEWIIPKEAVPDYLPVLKQITNEGRAMQQMDNGNTAMDALIAQASLQTGFTKPKSPMYQEGGNVLKLRTDTYTPEEVAQLDSIAALVDNLNAKWVEDYGGGYQSQMARYGYPNYGLPEEAQTADKGRWPSKRWLRKSKEASEAFERDKEKDLKKIEEVEASMQKVPMKSIDPSGRWGHTPAEHLWSLIEGQGNTAFPGLRLDEVEQPRYQEGGEIQPRKQQEMRNPEVYGPPVPADIDSLLNQIMMRDVNQSINPFTGDTINTVLDSIRLKQQMDKSKMPRAGRKKMRQGGPVMYANGGQIGAGQPLERMGPENMGEVTGMPQLGSISRPEFEAIMEYGGSPQASDSLMAAAGQDKRVKPVDKYIISGGKMQAKAQLEIPKLSTAYLPSFGMETPLSKRQQAALFRKGIAPQTLNPQVKGLINRALVQRLANEPL
jgi:hypothetical protein